MTYDKRSARINYPTNDICKRGLVRELKMLLLHECPSVGGRPEYDKVIHALESKLEGLKDYPDDGLFSEATYNKWWNGISFPRQKNQKLISLAYSGLIDRWMSRTKIIDRFQLHLASLDLYFIRSKNSEEALRQALAMVQQITLDWAPRTTGYLDQIDVCISGPELRGGYNPAKRKFQQISAARTGQALSEDPRENIGHDLTIGPTSFLGLDIEQSIADIYQENHFLSIIPFLFSLFCLKVSKNSSFQMDLLLDLLTALNCADLILGHKHEGIMPELPDQVERHFTPLILLSSELFHSNYWSRESQAKITANYNVGVPNLHGKYEHAAKLPYIGFLDCPSIKYRKVLLEILSRNVSEQEQRELSKIATASKTTALENKQEPPSDFLFSNAPDLFLDARESYFDLFKITGLSENQVIASLFKKFRSYKSKETAMKTWSTSRSPEKYSPYLAAQ